MSIVIGVLLLVVWLYLLDVLKRSELQAWRFFLGSCGLFVLMMIFIRPVATEPLAQTVAVIAGVFGRITGLFSSYFKYGVIFVDSSKGAISLLIDFECSGILEIMAFVSLLVFFQVYSVGERVVVGILGACYIVLANALRIISICLVIYFWGMPSYYVAHTFIGRILFYVLTIILYFIVFTKSHIIRQKVGGFHYGVHK